MKDDDSPGTSGSFKSSCNYSDLVRTLRLTKLRASCCSKGNLMPSPHHVYKRVLTLLLFSTLGGKNIPATPGVPLRQMAAADQGNHATSGIQHDLSEDHDVLSGPRVQAALPEVGEQHLTLNSCNTCQPSQMRLGVFWQECN